MSRHFTRAAPGETPDLGLPYWTMAALGVVTPLEGIVLEQMPTGVV